MPHVLSFDAELVLDDRTFERPANYLMVPRQAATRGGDRPLGAPVRGRRPRAGHGPGIPAASRPTAKSAWRCGPAIPLTSSASPAAGTRPDHRRHHARRSDLLER
ncbi:MAG: DUF3141 domain-containing protein [Sulfuritalea sp.]|nr:DUF3141 domain-containing protein [Sulfuritalea sp.]